MVKYVITVIVSYDEVSVSVNRNSNLLDEASFHITERDEFRDYMRELTCRIYDEVISGG